MSGWTRGRNFPWAKRVVPNGIEYARKPTVWLRWWLGL